MARPDYTKIADNDPTGDLQVALDAMKLLTEDVTPETHLINYRQVAKGLTMAKSKTLQEAIVATANIPDWVDVAMAGGDGININAPEVPSALTAMGLTEELKAEILALGVSTKLMFPDLRLGELQTARAKRLAGEA